MLVLRSTKLTDRNAALAVVVELERAAKLAGRHELVEAQAREILRGIMSRVPSGETMQAVSISEFFQRWLATTETRKAEGTTKRYVGVVKAFLKSLGARTTKPLMAITVQDIDNFVDDQIKSGMASSTVRVNIKIIGTALNAAKHKGLVSRNVSVGVELPAVSYLERSTFTLAEVQMLCAAADPEWETLVLLGFYTGARLTDCAQAKWECFDLAAGTWAHVKKKTGSKIVVPIHPTLSARLESVARLDTAHVFVMPRLALLETGGTYGLSVGFRNIMQVAGVGRYSIQGGAPAMFSKRSFHSLRHSFTSALANLGVVPELRMKLTGHKTESVHQKYSHHELSVLRAAVFKLPTLEKPSKSVG